jgi:puromycin-sensitive aminopeptidase
MLPMSSTVKRLFKSFAPIHYTLRLSPDRDALTFSGSVEIRGRHTGRPNKRLVFHQSGLKITKATIVRHDKRGDKTHDVERINLHKNFDEVRLHTADMLYPGDYTVTLEFSGTITKPMNGMYPSTFKDGKSEKVIIATQFESHHAREVFPCIDEPEAKATFDLSLTTPAGETVLANTPAKDSSEKGGKVTTTFETTPIMSTYLLAFAFGELDYLEAKTKQGTVVRTYATKDNVPHTAFALDVAVKTLDFYEEYFNIPYPLAKADMVALPDFAAGAMENWGLITYREHALLVDPKHTSVPTKQFVAMVVAHELAHQWFGNLVTMRWWTDLWLNEGFASWIEYLAVDTLFPDWGMWTQFLVDEQLSALKLDALEHTHPVEVPVRHPDEIRTIFDTISYNKGASVINMLHEYLGAEDFKGGLRHYLQLHAYKNTDTVDLWDALEHVSGKPVKSFMHAWTSLPGFPVVTADVGTKTVSVKQERFYINPEASKQVQHWPVPLLAGGGLHGDSFNQSEMELERNKQKETLKLNRHQKGFYRTVYDHAHLQKLSRAVEAGTLGPEDRLGLLSDTYESVKAGKAGIADALGLLQAYRAEQHAAVWDVMAIMLGEIRRVMDDDGLRDAMKPYIRELTAAELGRLGWEAKQDEPYFDTLQRPTILSLAAAADEPDVVKEALRRYKAMKQPEDIEPDLRGTVFGTAARLGGKAEFDRMLELHNASSSSEVRLLLTSAMTGFEQESEYKRALGLIRSPEVRLQDALYWLAYSLMNRYSKRAAWQWLIDNWAWVRENFETDMHFSQLPMYAARAFSDEPFIKEFKDFFVPQKLPSLERTVNQGIETLQWQIAWKKRDGREINTFFGVK